MGTNTCLKELARTSFKKLRINKLMLTGYSGTSHLPFGG